MENLLSPQTRQSTNLRGRLVSENRNLSYADHRTKIGKNVDSVPPLSSRNRQKRQVEEKSTDNEELVKYMSNLPCYLGRGEQFQEKAINFGVLDWRRLEKWQHDNREIPYRSSRCSLSSNTSFFSTDASSTRSSTGHSCSPTRQRMHTTLQSHLKASPREDYFRGTKSCIGTYENIQDLKPPSSSLLKGPQMQTHQYFNKHRSEIKPKEMKRRDSCPQVRPDLPTSWKLENYGPPSLVKGKMKIPEAEFTRGMEKLEDPCYSSFYHGEPRRTKESVFPSRDDPEYVSPAILHHSEFTAINVRRSSEASQRSLSEDSFSEGTCDSEFNPDIAFSCPLPLETDSIKHPQMKPRRSVDAKSIKFSSGQSEFSHGPLTFSSGPAKRENAEKKSSTSVRSSKVSDHNVDVDVAAKVKNPSPTRRFIVGMGRIGRNSSSKDDPAPPMLSSKYVSAKSGPARMMAPACLDNSTDKSNAATRARSSPLRRLLDPLLKPKVANSHHCVEPSSQKDETSAERGCRQSNEQVEPVKVKVNFGDCKTVNVDESHNNEKQGSSKVQALMQIAIKNGLPLFTFAVDSKSEILAATMKKSRGSRKDEDSWIYTFFTVREVKKRNGWMNHGGKGKGHSYVPNVVAQMKGSDSHFSKSRHNSTESIREFVLFRVDARDGDQQIPDVQPIDELAAIVVKFPRDNENNGSSVGGRHGVFSSTVILPGGVHGLPSKGEPSPLLERWKSGGACDCGGWDVGCRMKLLANQTQPNRRPVSSKPHPAAGQFELYLQGEVPDHRPIFSMSPFKDGIFSVEFSSSLTLLQAFAICLATLNSGKPFELPDFCNLFGGKFCNVTSAVENYETPNPVQVEIPTKYATCPPLSPVGRV